MKEYLPLYIPSEYNGLLVPDIHLLHITFPTIYNIYKPVVFYGNVIGSWIHHRQVMFLSYLNHSIIILRYC